MENRDSHEKSGFSKLQFQDITGDGHQEVVLRIQVKKNLKNLFFGPYGNSESVKNRRFTDSVSSVGVR